MTATRRPAARGAQRPARKPATRTAPTKKPTKPVAASRSAERQANPWNALWAMMVGFFMILVDSTIVSVANPAIMEKLNTDYDAVIWVTSAYLLAYAVPLLLAGRLGDRFGPKNLYLIGLFVFTAASLWCGLSGSVATLVAARVLQGIGAGLLTPQTLSTITRIFPPERRGVAMSVWGATAGVATLVGPLAGGILVDTLGWQWIFFVNVPIGVIGLGLAVWLVPVLPTEKHRFDVLGVVLSGIGMFLIVFALQEGQSHNWEPWIWGMIAGGVVFMAVFIVWQARNRREPLIPLRIFRDRDFSLANVGIATIGFVVTAMILPLMFYLQAVCGLSPTRAALLTSPMAIATGVLAPLVGRIVDRAHPRPIIGFGFSVLAIALTWLSIEMTPVTPIWRLVLPMAAMGVGMAFVWAPLAATATRNLSPQLAGAGSGVYNTTRQVGAVLGSASMAAFMTSRISAEAPGPAGGGDGSGQNALAVVAQLPDALQVPFSTALSASTLLPAFIALFGVVAALFLVGFGEPAAVAGRRADRSFESRRESDGRGDDFDLTDVIPVVSEDDSYDSSYHDDRYRREYASQPDLFRRRDTDAYPPASRSDRYYDDRDDDSYGDDSYDDDSYGDEAGYVDDDDDYVEYVLDREPHSAPAQQPAAPGGVRTIQVADEPDTEPLAVRVEHPRQAPAEVWHSRPVESWRSLLDEESGPSPVVEPIGFAHNGFHIDDDEHVRPVPPPMPADQHRPAHGATHEAPYEDSYKDSYSDSYDEAYDAFDNAYDSFKFFDDNGSAGGSESGRGAYRGHWSIAGFFDRPERPNHFELPEYPSPPAAGDYDTGSRHSQPDEPVGRSRHLLPEANERPVARHHHKESGGESRDDQASRYGRHSLPQD